MAMQDYYVEAVDALYDAIVAEDKLNPDKTDAERYINKVYKSDWIPAAGLPTLHCFIPSKPIEEHRGIGYGPFNTMNGRVTLRCEVTGEWTSKLLSDMGLTSIDSNDDLWRVMYYITNTIEEVLRREVNYRLSGFGANDVMIVRPNGTYFNSSLLGNRTLAVASVNVMFQQRVLQV